MTCKMEYGRGAEEQKKGEKLGPLEEGENIQYFSTHVL